MNKLLTSIFGLALSAGLAACGDSDDCGACAAAAAAAHNEATFMNDELTLTCTAGGGQSSLTIGTTQCEASALGITINVTDTIRETLTECGLSVPSECQ